MVLDDLPCAAVQTDGHGRILAANNELGRLLSRPASGLLDQSFDELLTRASRIFLESHVRPLLLREGEVSELVLHLADPQGGVIPLLVNIRAESQAAIVVHTWVLFEAHRRNEFERELIRARESMRSMAHELQNQLAMKDRLFTILGHDLRGPVGSATQLIDLIVGELAKGEPIDEALGLVQGSMHATYNLIENLLGWMVAQNTQAAIELEVVRPFELLQTVASWLEGQARAKGILLKVECSPSLEIRTGRRAAETIVRNLTSNALKYSHVGGLIVLAAQATAKGWSIEVRDNGVGVPPEKLAKLFGKTKLDSSPGTGQERGSGLGLMFCSELAQSLGGTLGAVNNPTGGSTFSLQVSLA